MAIADLAFSNLTNDDVSADYPMSSGIGKIPWKT